VNNTRAVFTGNEDLASMSTYALAAEYNRIIERKSAIQELHTSKHTSEFVKWILANKWECLSVRHDYKHGRTEVSFQSSGTKAPVVEPIWGDARCPSWMMEYVHGGSSRLTVYWNHAPDAIKLHLQSELLAMRLSAEERLREVQKDRRTVESREREIQEVIDRIGPNGEPPADEPVVKS
jgi:hypothetical protein